MNSAIPYMRETAVSDSPDEIAAGDIAIGRGVEQRDKHIMHDVACQIPVMKQCYRESMHLLIMRFKKPLYVFSFRHTLL